MVRKGARSYRGGCGEVHRGQAGSHGDRQPASSTTHTHLHDCHTQVPEQHADDLRTCMDLVRDRTPLAFNWDTSLYTGQKDYADDRDSEAEDANDQDSVAAAEPGDRYRVVDGAFQADATYDIGDKVLVSDDTMEDGICLAEVCMLACSTHAHPHTHTQCHTLTQTHTHTHTHKYRHTHSLYHTPAQQYIIHTHMTRPRMVRSRVTCSSAKTVTTATTSCGSRPQKKIRTQLRASG